MAEAMSDPNGAVAAKTWAKPCSPDVPSPEVPTAPALPGAVQLEEDGAKDCSADPPYVAKPSFVSFADLSAQVQDELSKVQGSSWDEVLEVLRRHGKPNSHLLRHLLTASAEKLNFWSSDGKLLDACCAVVEQRLLEHFQQERLSPKSDAFTADVKVEEVDTVDPTVQGTEQAKAEEDATPKAATPKANTLAVRSISKMGGWARQISGMSSRRVQSKQSCATTQSEQLRVGGSMSFSKVDTETQVPAPLQDAAKAIIKKEELLPSDAAAGRLKQFKFALFFFVLFQMVLFALYVVFYMTPETWDVIGFPVLVARGSAYGACFWTAILFLTMSRDVISLFARIPCIRNSQYAMQLLNSHKELHVFSAYEVLLDGCLHALMHHIGTFVALETQDVETLNDMLVCAKSAHHIPDGYLGKYVHNFLEALQYPPCPLPPDADVGYFDGVFSTPGITGYLLLAVICVLGWYSRAKKRRANFRLFYLLHHLLVPAWVILLVVHGANDWIGLGFPLAILVAAIPVLLYSWTRVRRSYLSLLCTTEVVNVEKSVNGKLLRLEVKLSSAFRRCRVGEYAYINVPQISLTQWHPYTICNSREEDKGEQVVTFCIMNVGKWTKALHAIPKPWGKVHIDGPFYAPTVSMPQRSTVVGIGAGVGVTPFLSFLGGLAGSQQSSHKNAHVFWMSAWATDFLLFRDLFTQLDQARSKTSGNTTKFHLHATPRFGGWDGKGLGCLFDLASQDVWDGWVKRLAAKDSSAVPTFCHYPKPLHAVVSHDLITTGKGKPVAVVMGSPDWIAEFLAIGDADLSEDVFVYFCGNPFLQNMIQSACIACNKHRLARAQTQRYYFYFERFG